MNNTTKIITVAAFAIFAGTAAYAAPHHHGGNNGVRLATDIVRLVGATVNTIAPRPVVVAPPPPVKVVVPPPRHHRPAPPPPPALTVAQAAPCPSTAPSIPTAWIRST